MGHWYPWATKDYILNELSWHQVEMYLYRMPVEFWKAVFVEDPDKPDLKAIHKMRMGKVIKRQ